MNRLLLTADWHRSSPRAHSADPRVRQKDARLENGVKVTRWSRDAKLSCAGLQVLILIIYICK